jgi:hypothetical protein
MLSVHTFDNISFPGETEENILAVIHFFNITIDVALLCSIIFWSYFSVPQTELCKVLKPSFQIYLWVSFHGCSCNYYRHRHYYCNIDALFLINVFKNEIDCYSIMDTAGLRVPTKQIWVFSTFNVSNVSRLSPSRRCFTSANNICKSLDVFTKHNISLRTHFSFA